MTKTILVGKAPLTTIRHADGTRSNLSAGAIVPNSVDPADAKRLVKEGYLEELDIVEEPGDDVQGEPTTIPEITAVVGDDPTKAQAYLDAELAAAKPRPTLVAALEAVVDGAKGGT